MDMPLSPVRQPTENNEEGPTNEVTYEPRSPTLPPETKRCLKIFGIMCGFCCCLPIGIGIGVMITHMVWSLITSWQFNVVCHLNNQSNYHYINGDTVSIMVTTLRRGRPILNLKDVRVNLIGEFVYYTVDINDDGESLNSHKVVFLDQRFTAHSMNISKKSRVPIGNHRRLFSAYLDHSLPPSINSTKSEIPHISYTIKIEVVPSEWYYLSTKKEYSIFIQRQLSRPPNIEKVIEQNKDPRDVQIRVSMEENTVIAGDMLEFDIDLRNPNQQQIHNISAKFDQIWDIGLNDSERISIGHDKLESFQSFRNKTFYSNYNLNVPKTSPGTFLFRHSSSMDKSFKLRYELVIEVQINDGLAEKRLNVSLSPIIINLNHIINDENSRLS